MIDHVILNLLNTLGKRDKMGGLDENKCLLVIWSYTVFNVGYTILKKKCTHCAF